MYVIPFKCIKSIGKDIVLVNVCLDKHKENANIYIYSVLEIMIGGYYER